MPPFGPIKRRDLVGALRRAGFEGPEAGKRHAMMRRGTRTIPIPNPQRGDVRQHLLAVILRQAGLSRDEWERL